VKRRELLRKIEGAGCVLVREGRGIRSTSILRTSGPAACHVKERLAAKILDDLGMAEAG
jgi:hypothetical protein